MADNPQQWARYFAALKGAPLDVGERGDPPSGYFRFPGSARAPEGSPYRYQRVLAIWRDAQDEICVKWNFGPTKRITALEAWEIFSSQCVPISFDLYNERKRLNDPAAPWPPIHTLYPARPHGDKPGGVWTEEWARKKLAADVENYDEHGEPRAKSGAKPGVEAIGANGGPPLADEPPAERPLSADEQLIERVKAVGQNIKKLLGEWGGEPRNKDEADTLGNYAVEFKKLENEAEEARKAEKEPHLRAGQAVDAKWAKPKKLAVDSREKLLKIAAKYLNAARAAAEAEAKKQTEFAQRQAERAGLDPADVKPVEVEKQKLGTGSRTISQRTKQVVVVTNYATFYSYLVEKGAIPPELNDLLSKIAQRLFDAGIKNIPGVEQQEVTVAQ